MESTKVSQSLIFDLFRIVTQNREIYNFYTHLYGQCKEDNLKLDLSKKIKDQEVFYKILVVNIKKQYTTHKNFDILPSDIHSQWSKDKTNNQLNKETLLFTELKSLEKTMLKEYNTIIENEELKPEIKNIFIKRKNQIEVDLYNNSKIEKKSIPSLSQKITKDFLSNY